MELGLGLAHREEGQRALGLARRRGRRRTIVAGFSAGGLGRGGGERAEGEPPPQQPSLAHLVRMRVRVRVRVRVSVRVSVRVIVKIRVRVKVKGQG